MTHMTPLELQISLRDLDRAVAGTRRPRGEGSRSAAGLIAAALGALIVLLV
jgi:hypothetical protein